MLIAYDYHETIMIHDFQCVLILRSRIVLSLSEVKIMEIHSAVCYTL